LNKLKKEMQLNAVIGFLLSLVTGKGEVVPALN
jgi:hypothetical protein